MPNVPLVPMFTGKGQLHVGGHTSIKGNLSGNVAVSLSDHVAVFANGSTLKNTAIRKDVKQQVWETGIGYFDNFGINKSRVFEVYAGYGKGATNKIFKDYTYAGSVPTEILDVDLTKVFVQVNYSSTKKHKLKLFGENYPINYGTALRLSHVAMQDFKINGTDHPTEYNVLVEPIFFTRMEVAKNLQLQYSNGMNIGLISRDYLKAGNTVFTLGVVYTLGK